MVPRPVRRFVLVAVVVAAGLFGLSRLGFRRTLSLPDAAGFVAPRDAKGRVVVAVTRDGRVRHGGKDVTLDELALMLDKLEDPTVVLRVDADALWCHVQWTLSVIREEVWEPIVFPAGDRELFAYCSESDPHVAPFYDYGARVAVGIEEDGSYTVGKRRSRTLHEMSADVETIREIADMTVFAIEARLHTPAIEALRVLDEFHAMGERSVLWALEPPHPWIREQRRLPVPRRNHRITQWFGVWDRCQHDTAPVVLPVALMAAEDRDDDEDDRVIINLDKHGRILLGGSTLSLDELRERLRQHVRLYDLRERAKGKSGWERAAEETEWSRLYVLLRADKDVPWLHVKWILNVLEEERLFKVQFATMKWADLTYTEEEARALGVERHDELPWADYGGLDAKLQCFLRTAGPSLEDYFIEETTREAIERRKNAAPKNCKVLGRITAADDTPFKFIVARVNLFSERGIEKVDFTGIDRAPRKVAAAERLPR